MYQQWWSSGRDVTLRGGVLGEGWICPGGSGRDLSPARRLDTEPPVPGRFTVGLSCVSASSRVTPDSSLGTS